MYLKISFSFYSVFFISQILNAQFLENSSFEGVPTINYPPHAWTTCHPMSTPDTQPGIFSVNTPPAKGKSFLGLVTRGNLGIYANTTEDCQTKLLKPITNEKCYILSVQLAMSNTQGHLIGFSEDFLSYNNAVKLKVWGGVKSCQKDELIWESPAITHTEWKKYTSNITVNTKSLEYLILEASYVGSQTYFGNVLIDDINIGSSEFNFTKTDTTVCEAESFVIDASAGTGPYLWSDGSTNETLTVTNPGNYWVEIQNNCFFVRREIRVDFQDCKCNFKTFNAFSPNADQENDEFTLLPLSTIGRYKFKVYNRWGEILFETNNYLEGWNGKYKNLGKDCSTGLYYWVAEFMCIDNHLILDKTLKGTVLLYR